jgi:hypothetical protein
MINENDNIMLCKFFLQKECKVDHIAMWPEMVELNFCTSGRRSKKQRCNKDILQSHVAKVEA